MGYLCLNDLSLCLYRRLFAELQQLATGEYSVEDKWRIDGTGKNHQMVAPICIYVHTFGDSIGAKTQQPTPEARSLSVFCLRECMCVCIDQLT